MKIELINKDEPFARIELTRLEFEELTQLLSTYPRVLSIPMHRLHCATINFLDKEG